MKKKSVMTEIARYKEKGLRMLHKAILENPEGIEGISGRHVEAIKNIAKDFPTWAEFYKEYRSVKAPTPMGILGRYYNKGKGKPPTADRLDGAIKTISLWIKYEGSLQKEDKRKLTKIRTQMEQLCPLEPEVHDFNYIKYYDCCHCGEQAPPGGHSISYKKSKGWKYPICDKCLEEETPLDMERLAELYYRYALTIEYALDKIYA